ncbi:MAG: sigma-70 family RNA polymerase sigma factor [Acidimicrobiales bacterium]
MQGRPVTAVRQLLDAADDLEAHLTRPTTNVARFVMTSVRAPSVDEDDWRLHVRYHRRRRKDDRRALVERYHGNACRLSRQYHRNGEPQEDLEQVALEALLLALERFEPARSLPFLGFANPTMVGALKRHFRDAGWAVRVPRRVHELSSALRDADELLTQDLGRPPSPDEVADLLGMPVAEVLATRIAQSGRTPASISPRAHDGEAAEDAPSLEATLGSDDRSIEQAEERVTIEAAVRLLDPRSRELLGLYFEDGLTQSQIAERLGVSQMQISRRLAQVLDQLRSHLPEA